MRKSVRVAGLVSLLVVAAVWVGLEALPTPSQFELDGNAVVDGSGDDWSNTVPISGTSEALVSTFIADGSGNATIFTGGGSKDINDISQWSWKDALGGLPDKDNITNAYAAAYATATGDLTIYFGADRFATAGDAELGFWFFHQRVQAVNGIFVGADGVTPASHTLGDILVLVNFSNGGSTVTAQVFKWNGSGISLVDTVTDAKCGTNSDPNVCAITNGGDAVAPWAYTPKQGTPGTFPAVSFFEGGINLSAFINTNVGGCFSSFLAETRSSTSPTSTLKDFALGEFDTCKLEIAKECPTVTFDEATNLLTYTSNITVSNKGFGTVFDVTVHDQPTPPGAAGDFTLASLDKNTSHVFTHTFSYLASLTSPNPPSNTATATAAVSPGGQQIVDAGSATATCPSVSFDASLTITKTCASSLEVLNGKLVVAVSVSGTVCNVPPPPGGQPFPEAIGGVHVTDVPAIDGQPIDLGTLGVGECKPYASKYYPSLLTLVNGNPSSSAGDQVFSDTAAAQGTGAITGAAKANSATATCPLCPPSHQ